MDSRPQLIDFHGISMTHYVTNNWENVQNFQARPDDILIATYPKAGLQNTYTCLVVRGVQMCRLKVLTLSVSLGTTWISYILDLLYFGQSSPERQTSVPIYQRVPFLEFAFSSLVTGLKLNRIPFLS